MSVIVLNGDYLMVNENNNKSITVEHGEKDLKEILSDYLIQKFEDIIKEQRK